MRVQKSNRGIALLFLKPRRPIWMGGQRHSPATLLPGKRPGTCCTNGRVSLKTCLDGCRKSRPHRDFLTWIPALVLPLYFPHICFFVSTVLFCYFFFTVQQKHPCPRRDSSPQSQQARGHCARLDPRTVQPVATPSTLPLLRFVYLMRDGCTSCVLPILFTHWLVSSVLCLRLPTVCFFLQQKRAAWKKTTVSPYLKQDANAEVHEGLREVDDAFSGVVNSHGTNCQVSFLQARSTRVDGRQNKWQTADSKRVTPQQNTSFSASHATYCRMIVSSSFKTLALT